MAIGIERAPTGSSLIEVLDRVLDKGIVIDACVRVSLVGIDLVTGEARVVVASIATYLQFTEAVGMSPALASVASAVTPSTSPEAPTSPRAPLTHVTTNGRPTGSITEQRKLRQPR